MRAVVPRFEIVALPARKPALRAESPLHGEIPILLLTLHFVAFHRRRLPHWLPSGKPLFLTWHLHGSLPFHRFPPPNAASAGTAFVWMDRYLDQARTGPLWLKREEIALLVSDAIRFAADNLRYCELHAYVVMANHVHMLALPRVDPGKLLQSVKGFTAREANKLLGRTGETFWQSESYDHWVRDDAEFERVRRYIESNPVGAGLVARPEDYRWSSAYAGSKARSTATAPSAPPTR